MLEVSIGDFIFSINEQNGTTEEREGVKNILLNISQFNEFIEAMTGVSHQIPNSTVEINISSAKNANGDYIIDGAGYGTIDLVEGSGKVNKFTIYLNPVLIDSLQYNVQNGSGQSYFEYDIGAVLTNELGNLVAATNPNYNPDPNVNGNPNFGFPILFAGNPGEIYSIQFENLYHKYMSQPLRDLDEYGANSSASQNGDIWPSLDAWLHALWKSQGIPDQNLGSMDLSGFHNLRDIPFGSWFKNGCADPSFLNAIPFGNLSPRQSFIAAPTYSPLVLDLDGDGVEVSKLAYGEGGSSTYFDMDNDGYAERTAWASGGDGILCIDRNNNGKIDGQSELFGNTSTYADGFANLKQYDSNNDNKITSADTQWSNLRIWVDANSDGLVDAGELKTLSELQITQVNLSSTTLTNTYNNENPVSATSTFVMNGATRTVSDVWFRVDTADTRYTGDVTLDVRTLFLPTLKGFGELKDLHVAMSLNPDLMTLVENFVSSWDISKFLNPTALNNEVRAILYKWAEVENVVDGSRGSQVDAKSVAFMEKFFGQGYGQAYYGYTVNQVSGTYIPGVLNKAYETIFDAMKAHLLVQVGAATLFEDIPVYQIISGTVSATPVLSLQSINDLSSEALLLPSTERQAFWVSVSEFILNIEDKSALSVESSNALNAAIVASEIGQTWDSISSSVISQYGPVSYSGTASSEYIGGTAGNDNLNGNGGDDTLNGGSGNDTIGGDDGNDTLLGLSGADTLNGGNGDDTLNGGTGNDILRGNAGNDTYLFNIGDGVDTISEGSGTETDTIRFGAGITASSLRFEKSGYDLNIYYGTSDKVTDYYHFYPTETGYNLGSGVETLILADGTVYDLRGSLTFTGTANADTMSGTKISDTLVGLGGNDTIDAGDGNDTLNGGTGNDILRGNAGDDTYLFNIGDGVDTISEGSGTETDTIRFGAGITASSLRFEKSGYDLNIYYGTSDKVTDYYHFYPTETGYNLGSGAETLILADGTVYNLRGSLTFTGTANADTMYGTKISDTLIGLGGNDTIYAGDGNDTLNGGAGNDYLAGDAGVDTVTYFDAAAAVTVNLNLTSAQNTVGSGSDTLVNIECLIGSLYNDILSGNSADNTIDGGSGNDVIDGGAGNDVLIGGAGTDQLSYASATAGVTVNLTTTTAQNTVGAGTDTISGFEDIFGSAFNDTLTGDGSSNTIEGGLGNDILNGGAGTDTVSYASATSAVTVSLATTAAQNTIGAGTDTLSNFENILGSNYNDNLFGNASANRLTGGLGDDYLYGSAGADVMDGGSGFDTVSYMASTAAVNVNLATNTHTGGDAAGDSLLGIESVVGSSYNDTIRGSTANESLYGGSGVDTLYGGTGNDVLVGGAGADVLWGETGADTFKFDVASAGSIDTVKDFKLAESDKIDIKDLLIGYDAVTKAITDYIECTTSGANTIVKVDRDGLGTAYTWQQVATFENVTGLTDEAALKSSGTIIA